MKITTTALAPVKKAGKRKPMATLALPLERTVDLSIEADRWLLERVDSNPVYTMASDALERTIEPMNKAKVAKPNSDFNQAEHAYEREEQAENEQALLLSWQELSEEERETALHPINGPLDNGMLSSLPSQWSRLESVLWLLLRRDGKDAWERESEATTYHTLSSVGLQTKPTKQLEDSWYAKPEAEEDRRDRAKELGEHLDLERHGKALAEVERLKAEIQDACLNGQRISYQKKERLCSLLEMTDLLTEYQALLSEVEADATLPPPNPFPPADKDYWQDFRKTGIGKPDHDTWTGKQLKKIPVIDLLEKWHALIEEEDAGTISRDRARAKPLQPAMVQGFLPLNNGRKDIAKTADNGRKDIAKVAAKREREERRIASWNKRQFILAGKKAHIASLASARNLCSILQGLEPQPDSFLPYSLTEAGEALCK